MKNPECQKNMNDINFWDQGSLTSILMKNPVSEKFGDPPLKIFQLKLSVWNNLVEKFYVGKF